MKKQTFIAIGRIPGLCVMIHKDDMDAFLSDSNKPELNCVVVDLLTGNLSVPITIQQMIDVCPFDEVTSIGEISVLSDLLVDVLPEWKVEDINETFVRLKKPFNRIEVTIEPLSQEHPLLE